MFKCKLTAVLVGLGLWLALGGVGMAAAKAVPAEMYALAAELQSGDGLVMVGTIDENGFPQIRVMSNLRNDEHDASKLAGNGDFTAYAITRVTTDKLKHLAKNPNMSMYYHSGGDALLLMGKGEVVTDKATRNSVWEDGFEQMGYDGPDDPQLVVLRFTPTHGKLYHNWELFELTFTKGKR